MLTFLNMRVNEKKNEKNGVTIRLILLIKHNLLGHITEPLHVINLITRISDRNNSRANPFLKFNRNPES